MTADENPTPAHEPGKRGQGSLIVSLALVGLLVIGGAVAWIVHDRGDDTPGAAGPQVSTSATLPAPTPGVTGFAAPTVDDFGRRVDIPNNPAGQPLSTTTSPLSATDPQWLSAAPAGTTGPGGWQKIYGAVVPFSTSDGPTRIDGNGLAAGWAHTPQGAALAAAYIWYMELARPRDRVLREQLMVMTPEQLADYDRALTDGRITASAVPESVSRWMVAAEAFKIVSWNSDLCILRLATKAAPDSLGATSWMSSEIAMVWDGDSWRRRLPPSTLLPQERIHTLAGWIRW